MIFVFSPACFVIAWWLVNMFAKYAGGSGIPQAMAAIELANPRDDKKVTKLLSLKVFFVKIFSGFIMILGGGLIGKEGPTIQIAGTVFRKINEWLPSWWPKISKRNMIMTGAAAAFNTPLGGIVFAVEELTKTHISYFKTALFTAVIIAGLTAQGMLGPYLYLGYPDVSGLSKYIFFPLILVAAITGLLGSGMSKIIMWIIRWMRSFKFKYQHFIYVLVCGLVIASIAYFMDPRVLWSGKEIMTTTLFTPANDVVRYTAIDRIIGTMLSFTTGAAGGIFAPALGAGAGVGSLLAGWLEVSANNTNLLILCGMVGFLTGVTRTSFTSAILVLEMTGRHSIIFHLMIADLVASIISIVFDKHSLYDHLKIQYMHDLYHEDTEEPKRIPVD